MTAPLIEPWTVLSEEILHAGDPWVSLRLQRVRLPDGREIDRYYRIKLPEFAVVVAVKDSGDLVVERNYKHGVGRVILDMPAGMLDEKEDPLAGAKRELLEETGYASDRWRFLGKFPLHANYGCGVAHFFLAEDVRRIAEPDSGDLEEMEISTMPLEDLERELKEHRIHLVSMATAIGLARLAREGRI